MTQMPHVLTLLDHIHVPATADSLELVLVSVPAEVRNLQYSLVIICYVFQIRTSVPKVLQMTVCQQQWGAPTLLAHTHVPVHLDFKEMVKLVEMDVFRSRACHAHQAPVGHSIRKVANVS